MPGFLPACVQGFPEVVAAARMVSLSHKSFFQFTGVLLCCMLEIDSAFGMNYAVPHTMHGEASFYL